MNFNKLKDWLSHLVCVKNRLEKICLWYLLFLMVATRKHSLQEAERFSGLNRSQFSKFLKNHSELAVSTLNDLSHDLFGKQAKQFAKAMKYLANNNLPWKVAILIDSTIQHRSTRHTENAKRFNHGQGFVIGHQWTNMVLIINDKIIPLPPIPFHSKRYCRKNGLTYKTEHDLVVGSITHLDLEEYIGPYDPKEVVVIADSGYDGKKIESAIVRKGWTFIMALGKTRSVKSEKQYLNTPESGQWTQVAEFFKNHRRLKWQTIRIATNSTKTKRMEFRVRQIIGYLRHVGRVQLICSELRKRPDGRRKYLACNDLRATAREILMGYRIRWSIEIFHKEVKMFLGFEDVATKGFLSVKAHVHWVYCAYILLHFNPPGVPEHLNTVAEKQRRIREIIDSKEKSRVIQKLTQIGGVEGYKNELRRDLEAA